MVIVFVDSFLGAAAAPTQKKFGADFRGHVHIF
jgi:hypothetical protein